MLKRLLIAAALLAMIHGVVLALRYERWPSDIASPEVDLAEIPYNLGNKVGNKVGNKLGNKLGTWTGQDSTPDPSIFAELHADHVVDRMYKRGEEEAVLLHASDYQSVSSLTYRWVPHPPQICYDRADWRLVDERTKVLQLDGGRSARVRLSTFEQEENRILVLFWYHFGDEIVLDDGELRAARWHLIGKRTWPAITKFMLQIQVPGGNRERAEMRVTQFAQEVLNWVMENRRPAEEPAGGA